MNLNFSQTIITPVGITALQKSYHERASIFHSLTNGGNIMNYVNSICYTTAAFYCLLLKPNLTQTDVNLLTSTQLGQVGKLAKSPWYDNLKSNYTFKKWDGETPINGGCLILFEHENKIGKREFVHTVAKIGSNENQYVRGVNGAALQMGIAWNTQDNLKKLLIKVKSPINPTDTAFIMNNQKYRVYIVDIQ